MDSLVVRRLYVLKRPFLSLSRSFSLSNSVALKTYKDIRETEETEKKFQVKKKNAKEKRTQSWSKKERSKREKDGSWLDFLFRSLLPSSLSLSLTHTLKHTHTRARTLTQFFLFLSDLKSRKEPPQPGVNSINILCTKFSYERRFGSFFYVHVTREKLPKQCSYKKFVRKMLMKLTTAGYKIEVERER